MSEQAVPVSEMFWVMTVQGQTPGGISTHSRGGTITPNPETTQEKIFWGTYRKVADIFRQDTGATGDPSVMFWSLTPNALPLVER